MNTKAGFLVFVGAVLLGAGTTAGISYAIGANYGPEITQQEESKDDSGLVTDIVEQKGIRMALLSSIAIDGNPTQFFTYEITPENATNKNVNISVEYESGGTATEIQAQLYTQDQLPGGLGANPGNCILVKAQGTGFSKSILVKVMAADGSGVSASVKCDFKKKILSWSYNSEGSNGYTGITFGDTGTEGTSLNSGNATFNDFFFKNDCLTPNYSLYTIDTDFTTMASSYWNTADLNCTSQNLSSYPVAANKLSTAIIAALKGEANFPSAETIYNYANGESYENAYKSYLKNSDRRLDFDLSGSVGTTERYPYYVAILDFTDEEVLDNAAGCLSLKYDFTTFTLSVDNITTSDDSLIF